MVQLKAKDLRWCPYWFEFGVIPDECLSETPQSVNMTAFDSEVGVYISGTSEAVKLDEPVWVDEKAYEEAMLEVLSSIFLIPTIWIKKHETKQIVCCNKHGFLSWIKIDPRPWEEEYKINVDNKTE